jgi:hypothetical protein
LSGRPGGEADVHQQGGGGGAADACAAAGGARGDVHGAAVRGLPQLGRSRQLPHAGWGWRAFSPPSPQLNRYAFVGMVEHMTLSGLRSSGKQCSVRLQDALVPGLTKASMQQGLAERFGVDSDEQLKGRTMAGWYLQQVSVAFLPFKDIKEVKDLSVCIGTPTGVPASPGS